MRYYTLLTISDLNQKQQRPYTGGRFSDIGVERSTRFVWYSDLSNSHWDKLISNLPNTADALGR